ncbi:MAG: hypothetical protein M5U28_37315 [Sandaracinaceae bacterium]|nr:hypothetical protein [Sandaracinaceae bacterium]
MRRSLVFLAALTGCTSEATLVVDVRTDYLALLEFTTVEAEVFAGADFEGGGTVRRVQVGLEDDGPHGIRVGEWALAPGSYGVRARLLAPDGFRVAERRAVVEVDGLRAVTLVASRRCAEVECPAPGGDPSASECVDGVCVPLECTPDDPSTCGGITTCDADSDCARSAECAIGECLGGFCAPWGDDERCADGEYCDVERGCLPRPPPCTEETCVARSCEVAECLEGACWIRRRCAEGQICCVETCAAPGCDDGDPCTADACGAAGCEHAPQPDGGGCDDGLFCNGPDQCRAGRCDEHPGDPCSGSATCDESTDTCIGCVTDGDCPATSITMSPCAGFSDVCDRSGTQDRTELTYRCQGRACIADESVTTQGCLRDTDGTTCGPNGRVCDSQVCVCPAATETCDNGVDDDCDGSTDCADPTCDGQACEDGAVCTGGETCQMRTCRGGAPTEPVERCETASGLHGYLPESSTVDCTDYCGFTFEGPAWRIPTGGTRELFLNGPTVYCTGGGEPVCANFLVTDAPSEGAPEYCTITSLGTYHTSAAAGTVPIYRFVHPTSGVHYTGIDGTQPAGFSRGRLMAYACPP